MFTPILQAFRSVRFEIRSLLAREPALRVPYQVIVKWGQYKIRRAGRIDIRERVVGPHTEIVIDGFQGSANSFLTRAFKAAQTRPVMLAHHLHSPAQIIQAVERGLPTIVTIREPRGAVLSLTSRWTYVSTEQALRGYLRFYERILPYADGFVISPFAWTTGHVDAVVEELNRRFGTDFAGFEHTEANVAALRGTEEVLHDRARRRSPIKTAKARGFETANGRRLLAQAEVLHRSFERASTLREHAEGS